MTVHAGSNFHLPHAAVDGPVESYRAEQIAGTTEGPGDRGKLWRLLGHEAADQFSFRAPSIVNKVTPMVTGAIEDGEYSRALFGNLSFLWAIVGAVLGLLATIEVKGVAVPPTLVLVCLIMAVGILDAFGGLVAFTVFAAGVLFTGHLFNAHALLTLFGLSVIWYAGPQIPHKLRPLQRYPHREGFDRGWRIAGDWAIDCLLVAFICGSMAELANILTGYDVLLAEEYKTIWVVSVLVMLVRLSLQSLAMYYFPRRMVMVRAARPPKRNRFLSLFFQAIVQPFIVICALWAVMGFRWQLWAILVLYMAMVTFERLEVDFPEITWVHRFVPVALTRILLAMITGQLAASYFISNGIKSSQELTAWIFLVVACLLLLLSAFEKFEGEEWPEHAIWKFLGFAVTFFLAAFATGFIKLY